MFAGFWEGRALRALAEAVKLRLQPLGAHQAGEGELEGGPVRASMRLRMTFVRAHRSAGHSRSSSVNGLPAKACHVDAGGGSSANAFIAARTVLPSGFITHPSLYFPCAAGITDQSSTHALKCAAKAVRRAVNPS
jgi:hypothetical protein